MLNSNEVNILGNIFNTTYGRSSAGTYNCTANLEGNVIKINYNTTAYFASERSMQIQQSHLAQESNARLSDFLTHVKEQFKEMSGSALKLEKVSNKDSLDLINASMNSPRRVFSYRRVAYFEILNGGK